MAIALVLHWSRFNMMRIKIVGSFLSITQFRIVHETETTFRTTTKKKFIKHLMCSRNNRTIHLFSFSCKKKYTIENSGSKKISYLILQLIYKRRSHWRILSMINELNLSLHILVNSYDIRIWKQIAYKMHTEREI